MKKFLTRLVLEYVRFLARLALAIKRPTIIGITGSVGKTSTRDAVYAVLKDRYPTHVIRKGNSETGVPLGILGLEVHSLGFDSIHKSLKDWVVLLLRAPFQLSFPGRCTYMIIEMGIDDPYPPKNMSYLLSVVQPDIAIVLNAYPTHAEQFEKVIEGPVTESKIVSAIAQEKVKLITHNPRCKLAIYNKDNEFIAQFLDEIDIDYVNFGADAANHLSYVKHAVTTEHTTFTFKAQDNEVISLDIPGQILPEAFREVFAPAILLGQYVGMELEDIEKALEKNFTIEPGRSNLLHGAHNALIIDSSYNASREAVSTMLDLAYQLKVLTQRPLVFVFGDMRELGRSAEREHTRIAETLSGRVDYLYTVGPLTHRYVYTPLQHKRSFEDIQAFEGPHEAGKYLKENLPENALVLFKGSQNTIFLEEAIKYILADAQDAQRLPRQEDYWMRKKLFSLRSIEKH
jgi:UDP-N-acetylmuramoyl-tripeptide--D-alanyl-D-alanine ligase